MTIPETPDETAAPSEDNETVVPVGARVRYEFGDNVLVTRIRAVHVPDRRIGRRVYELALPDTHDDELLLWRDEFTVLDDSALDGATTADEARLETITTTAIEAGYAAAKLGGNTEHVARAAAWSVVEQLHRDSALNGATTAPPEGTDISTPGEFAARWNDIDEETRRLWLDAMNEMAAASVRCWTEHSRLADDLAEVRALHEIATARSAQLRVTLEGLLDAWDIPSMNGRDHDIAEAIDAAHEVLAAMPEPRPNESPTALRSLLDAIVEDWDRGILADDGAALGQSIENARKVLAS